MTRLEILDLSGNKIRTVAELSALKHLNSLLVCNLKGNPICLLAEYPSEIFALQTHLLKVDDW